LVPSTTISPDYPLRSLTVHATQYCTYPVRGGKSSMFQRRATRPWLVARTFILTGFSTVGGCEAANATAFLCEGRIFRRDSHDVICTLVQRYDNIRSMTRRAKFIHPFIAVRQYPRKTSPTEARAGAITIKKKCGSRKRRDGVAVVVRECHRPPQTLRAAKSVCSVHIRTIRTTLVDGGDSMFIIILTDRTSRPDRMYWLSSETFRLEMYICAWISSCLVDHFVHPMDSVATLPRVCKQGIHSFIHYLRRVDAISPFLNVTIVIIIVGCECPVSSSERVLNLVRWRHPTETQETHLGRLGRERRYHHSTPFLVLPINHAPAFAHASCATAFPYPDPGSLIVVGNAGEISPVCVSDKSFRLHSGALVLFL
jgi:hypothetical protein